MILKWHRKIEEYMRERPGKYIKIDDMRIDLLASKKSESFDRAWKELIICGRVESCGNAIRINQ